MNIASAVIAPPPASSRRCGATLAWARASSSTVNGALRLNWLPFRSRRACERASRSSTPASCHHRSRVIVIGASQLCVRYRPLSPGRESSPATSQVTSTGPDPEAPALDGANPRGTAEPSGGEPTTWIRTPAAARTEGTGPPPTSSIGQRSGRQGPSRPGNRAGEPPAQLGNRGRTHDHTAEPHRVHQQHLGRRPQAEPVQQGPRLVRHAGADWSLPGDADQAVERRCPAEHRSGALVARDLGLCRHARGERRRQRNTQCGQQPPCGAPPAPRGGQHQRRKPAPQAGGLACGRHPVEARPDPHSGRSFRSATTGHRTTPLSHHADAGDMRWICWYPRSRGRHPWVDHPARSIIRDMS